MNVSTQGHVDFAWEVSRSLAACQGALLLVDASQGVQAQSISVFRVAQQLGVRIVPVLNKVGLLLDFIVTFLTSHCLCQIDLPAARPEEIAAQMEATFGIDPASVIRISAKTGRGVSAVLDAIIERIPPPPSESDGPLRAFLFDSSLVWLQIHLKILQ